MLPLKDYNPTERLPWVTILLIAANLVIFLLVQRPYDRGLNQAEFSYHYAAIPCELTVGRPLSIVEARRTVRLGQNEACDRSSTGDDSRSVFPGKQVYLAVIYSMFLHGSWLHIGGNMLFLWVFGNNIEDHLGRVKFILFYLLGGIAAALAHVLWALRDLPCTSENAGACVPAIGASGAVAAVMGAYLLLYPRARVNVLVPIIIIFTVVQMSAFLVLGLWFLYQFLIAAQESVGSTGVAWMAHVGGFVFGLVAIFLLGGRPHRAPPMWPGNFGY